MDGITTKRRCTLKIEEWTTSTQHDIDDVKKKIQSKSVYRLKGVHIYIVVDIERLASLEDVVARPTVGRRGEHLSLGKSREQVARSTNGREADDG